MKKRLRGIRAFLFSYQRNSLEFRVASRNSVGGIDTTRILSKTLNETAPVEAVKIGLLGFFSKPTHADTRCGMDGSP